MTDIKRFRRVNNLLQKDLADYLGVSREFVSMVESGRSILPHDRLRKLLDNEHGWDTSMLSPNIVKQSIGSGSRDNILIAGDVSAELLALKRENEMLRQQLEEAKAQNQRYWTLLEKLMEK